MSDILGALRKGHASSTSTGHDGGFARRRLAAGTGAGTTRSSYGTTYDASAPTSTSTSTSTITSTGTPALDINIDHNDIDAEQLHTNGSSRKRKRRGTGSWHYWLCRSRLLGHDGTGTRTRTSNHRRRSVLTCSVAFWTVAAASSACCLVMLFLVSAIMLEKTPSSSSSSSNITSKQVNIQIDAVVTIAAGEYSPVRLITGLRKYGKFDGPTYVLTDNVEGLTEQMNLLNLRNVYPVSFNSLPPPAFDSFPPGTTSSTKQTPPATAVSDAMRIMWYKTQIREIIATAASTSAPNNTSAVFLRGGPKINTVLFADSDIQVKGTLEPIEEFISKRNQHRHQQQHRHHRLRGTTCNDNVNNCTCVAYFFHERHYVEDRLNAGLGIIRLDLLDDACIDLLTEWSQQILDRVHKNDQAALSYLAQTDKYNSNKCGSSTITNKQKICTLPSVYNYYTTDALSHLYDTISFGWRKRKATFLHPTGGKSLEAMARPDDGTLEGFNLVEQGKKFIAKRLHMRLG